MKPDWVIVNSAEEKHPEGAYYLDWYEGKKRVRLSVGKDAATAAARKFRKEAELRAVAEGVIHRRGPRHHLHPSRRNEAVMGVHQTPPIMPGYVPPSAPPPAPVIPSKSESSC